MDLVEDMDYNEQNILIIKLYKENANINNRGKFQESMTYT